MKTNNTFNAQKFAEAVTRAKGSRTQKDFAIACGISIPRMCNMINAKITKAPTQRTLQKIVDHAENGVTLRDLILSTLNEIDTPITNNDISVVDTSFSKISEESHSISESMISGLLLTALSELGCRATALGNCLNFNRGTVTCTIQNAPIDLWQFRYIVSEHPNGDKLSWEQVMEHIKTELGIVVLNNYHAIYDINEESEPLTSFRDMVIATKEVTSSKPKVSFIVTDNTAFENIMHYCHTPFLNILLSVIQVDMETFKVVKESYLPTGVSLDDYNNLKNITF